MARQRKKSVLDIRSQENRIMEEAARRQTNGTMSQQRYYQIAGRVNRTTQNYLGNIRNRTNLVNRLMTAMDNDDTGMRDRALGWRYSPRTYMGLAKE